MFLFGRRQRSPPLVEAVAGPSQKIRIRPRSGSTAWLGGLRIGQLTLIAIAITGAAVVVGSHARPIVPPTSVAIAELPPQARATHQLIRTGGPFAYEKDGSVFANRESQLPAKTQGFYREYTVRTPGAKDRGARRIVCGGVPPTQPETCFYTDDHYASFRRIAP